MPTILRSRVDVASLGPIDHLTYLPPDYAADDRRYPVLVLLHGRGDSMESWQPALHDLDELVAAGVIRPVIAVAPDAPWSSRASWWVDSRHSDGRPVATAMGELIASVDEHWRTLPDRTIAGYSMGGAGALHVARHADSVLAMSPAVYVPLPPADSNTRRFGAFGEGERLFDEERYTALNYPTTMAGFTGRLRVTVGGSEPMADAQALYDWAKQLPGATADYVVVDGGHDWGQWRDAFRGGLSALLPAVDQTS
jgi:enterochelin esterase-like enzyme